MRLCTDSFSEDGSEWYNFKSLENLPPYSCKYELDPDNPLSFRRPPGTKDFYVIELPLRAALETMEEEEQFLLNPARWNNVTRDLSEGWCYHPWMSALPGGRPTLQNGRHRIVTMMRLLGMTSAPFVVEPEHIAAVKAWPEFKLATA
ncbi:hypothetical protein SAMN04487959_114134 [Modicisalibacter xianhensis]|uniref:Uncharacterized protein n=2 Tax=Modicisalibacter xianhensis TaxID=442341 RepID=A0A1I3ERL1_9GAMM|nr:hypothetical protein SAMN04487959_114134 [Halomonas xianhensis]